MLLLLFSACTPSSTEPSDSVSSADTITAPADTFGASTAAPARLPLIPEPECPTEEQSLEENRLWLPQQQLKLLIVADSTTYDPRFGPSHRRLQVFRGANCELIYNDTLPVNFSPDFPYYFAAVNYNNAIQLVAIRGFDRIYFYDIRSNRMLPPVQPAFSHEVLAEDAQTGLIKHTELWEHYLVGYAEDGGAFVFDLSNRPNPQPVMPLAEHHLEDEFYNSLFLLGSNAEKRQAIMPEYNYRADRFEVHPLFEKPLIIDTAKAKTSPDGRYISLNRSDNGEKLVIDLEKRALSSQPTTDN